MSETMARIDGGRAPAGYATNQQPYTTYGANPNYPMAPQSVVFAQPMIYVQPMDPAVHRIHEYLPWSIINLFCGGLFLGIIAIALSMQTRSRKRANDAESARKWSIATLIWNIFSSLAGIGLIIFLIVWFVAVVKAVSKTTSSYYYWG